MIITLVIDTFNINNNGTTISAMCTAKELKGRGHSIRVVTCGDPSKSGLDADTGYEMFYVPELHVPIASRFAHKQNTLFARPVLRTLAEAIDGADIVHIYQPWSLGNAARKIAEKYDVPAIAAFHIQPENITYNIGLKWLPAAAHLTYLLLYSFFYRKFAHIHCPSKFIAAELRSHGYKAWLHVISNGVHPDFQPEEHAAHAGELFKILTVGRLSPEKRQDVLIRAVRQSKYADRIQLYFAGTGPWEKRLRRLGDSLPHPPVFGYYDRKDLIRLIRSCDLYVHASDVEIEGISCMEAFSCGLVPVISNSRHSATRQFALSENNLFEAGDPASLAQRIDYWLEDETRRRAAGEAYARYGREYTLKRSVRQMERVYETLPEQRKNNYCHGLLFKFFSGLFYGFIAVPILFVWTHVFLGLKIVGKENLRGLNGAVTLCNHVHLLDCVMVALALFPRKAVFPTLPENLDSPLYGKLVRLLGGAPIPDSAAGLRVFFHEMELCLAKGSIVHFYPEGELKPYDSNIREFKRGAFYLAARARVPVVPMTIAFERTKGLRRLFRKKPTMTLYIGKPIKPVAMNLKKDSKVRMNMASEQMHFLRSAAD